MNVLGPFGLTRTDGSRVTITSKKARAVLAMLAVAPGGRRERRWLQYKLWSERGEREGAASLRQTLSALRRALAPMGDVPCVTLMPFASAEPLTPQAQELAEQVLDQLALHRWISFMDWAEHSGRSAAGAARPATANYAVTGQLRQSGGRLVLMVELTHLTTGQSVKRAQFTAPLADAADIGAGFAAVAPDYEPARRELTLLLAYRGDVTAARYHAERLVAETADEQLRAGLQTFILNNSSRKPGGFALRFALLPSSNQTRGSAEQEILIGGVPFTLNPASRASSGVGLAIGGTAWRRWQWNERWSGVGTASLDAKFYDSALNTETTAVARFDVIRGGQRGRFSFGPIAELSFSDSDIVRRRWGAELRGAYQLRPRDLVSGALRFDRQTYDQSPFRDGHRMRASVSYQHRLTPTLGLSFGLSHLRETTQRAHLDHHETGVSMGIDKQWKSGLSTGVILAYEQDRYDGIFPGTTTPREDDTTSLTFTVQHNKVQIGKYVPRITYTYTRAKSNVALFDYDSHDIGASLSLKF